MPPENEALVVGIDGKKFYIPAEKLADATQKGYRQASPEEAAAQGRLEVQTQEYGSAEGLAGVGQKAAAYVGGLAKGTGTAAIYAPNPESSWADIGLPRSVVGRAAHQLLAPELTDEQWEKKIFGAVEGYTAANPKTAMVGEALGGVAAWESGGEVLGALGAPIKRALGIGADAAKAAEIATADSAITPRVKVTEQVADRALKSFDFGGSAGAADETMAASPRGRANAFQGIPDLGDIGKAADAGPNPWKLGGFAGGGPGGLLDAIAMALRGNEGIEVTGAASPKALGGFFEAALPAAADLTGAASPEAKLLGIEENVLYGGPGARASAEGGQTAAGFGKRMGVSSLTPEARVANITDEVLGKSGQTRIGLGDFTRRIVADEPSLGPAARGAAESTEVTAAASPQGMGGAFQPSIVPINPIASAEATAATIRPAASTPLKLQPAAPLEQPIARAMAAATPKPAETASMLKILGPSAGDVVLGAMQGASATLSRVNFSRDPKLTGEQLLWGAFSGGALAGVTSVGVRGLSGFLSELAVPSANRGSTAFEMTATQQLKAPSKIAKFLVDAEAHAGIRAVTSGEGVPQEALSRAGGPAELWRIWKSEIVSKMGFGEKLNFASPEFQQTVAKKLEAASAEHGDLLAGADKLAPRGAMTASDIVQPIDNSIDNLKQRLLRDSDIAGLEKLKGQVYEKLGVTVGADGQPIGLDGPITLGKANQVARLIDDAAGPRARSTTFGRELDSVRNQLDSLVEKRAAEILGPTDGKAIRKLADARGRLFAFQTMREATSEVGAAALRAGAGDVSGGGRALAFAGLSVGLGHPVVAAGQLVGYAAGRVLRRYGDLIAAETFGKAAQLAGVEAGAARAAQELKEGISSAARGEGVTSARRMTDKEVIGVIDDLARMTPEAIQARAENIAGVLGHDLPDVASAMAMTSVIALNYLRNNLPKPIPVPYTPGYTKRYDPGELRQFRDRLEMTDHPKETTREHLARRDISPEHVDALRSVYPAMHNEARRLLMEHFLELGKLSKPQFRIAWLFDVPIDPGAHPEMFMIIQNARASADQMRAEGQKAPQQSGSMRMMLDPLAASIRSPSADLQQGPTR